MPGFVRSCSHSALFPLALVTSLVVLPAEGSPQAGGLQDGQSDRRVAELRREIVLNRDRLSEAGLSPQEYWDRWQALFNLARLRIERREFDHCLEDFALGAGPLGPTASGVSDMEPGGIWPPPFLEFFYYRGNCRRGAGKNPEAIADFDRLIGRLEVNVATCDSRLASDPTSWCEVVRQWRHESLFTRGLAHFQLNNFAQAIEDLSPTIDDGKPPELVPSGLKFRALAYLQTGALERALVDLTAALSRDPDSGEMYLLRGMIHEESGRTAEACKDYRDALRHGTDNDKLAAQVAEKCSASRSADGRQQLERAAEDGDLAAMLALGKMHQDAGRHLEARRWYDRVLEFEAIEEWEREEAGPERVQAWDRAHARLRELYAQAPLFPEPLEGWASGEIEVSATRVDVPLTGLAVRRILSRTYRDATGQTVVIRFRLHDGGSRWIDALHDGDGGDPGKAPMVEALETLGTKVFRKDGYRGTRTEDALFVGTTIMVTLFASEDGMESGVVELTGTGADAYLEQTDLAAAHTLLAGHGFYRLELPF